MYILEVGPFSSLIGPDQGRFYPHFRALRAHSDTFYGLKLVYSALKALTKPIPVLIPSPPTAPSDWIYSFTISAIILHSN